MQTDEEERTVSEVAQMRGFEPLVKFLDWTKSTIDKSMYYLPTPPIVLIMYTTADRPEAEEERETLTEIIPQFHLSGGVHNDLDREEMLSVIRQQQRSHLTISGMIVIIMSHGQRGAVYDKNNKPVNIHEVLMTMSSGKLYGKPKVSIDSLTLSHKYLRLVPQYDLLCYGKYILPVQSPYNNIGTDEIDNCWVNSWHKICIFKGWAVIG